MPPTLRRITFFLLAITLLAGSAEARLPGVLKLDVGWGGLFRGQRWSPVQVTLSDPTAAHPYRARLDVYIPYDTSTRMIVSQTLAITGQETSYLLYLPLPYSLDAATAVLTDIDTDTTIARLELDQLTMIGGKPILPPSAINGDTTCLLGVAGQGPALHQLTGPFDWAGNPVATANQARAKQISIGYLPVPQLPDIPQAYDSIDVLVLNAPDLSAIPLKTQQAIASWVQAGGRLLLWPGVATTPGDGPLAQVLPCTIQDPFSIHLSIPDTRALGVAARNERLPAWKLTPRPGASQTPALLDKAMLCQMRQGYGTVAVLSADPSSLVFDNQRAAARCFEPIVRQIIGPMHEAPTNDANYGGNGVSFPEQWRSAAAEVVVDRLGNIPGVGAFNFGYVAFILLALMFIVGPVDYFVLRKLGRQPWTWATTAGWVGLITAGGLLAGRILRSGDLHFRTVQLIDQVDNQAVSSLIVAGIYSPSTRTYDLQSAPEDWWQPVSFDRADYFRYRRSSPGQLSDMPFIQDRQGQHLREDALNINIWDLRFLQASRCDTQSLKPILRANVHRVDAQGSIIAGSITNLGAAPLRNVCIRCGGNLAMITAAYDEQGPAQPGNTPAILPSAIEPGQTVNFKVTMDIDDAPLRIGGSRGRDLEPWRIRQAYSDTPQPQLRLIHAISDLQIDRSERIDSLLADSRLACIYAQADNPSSPARLASGGLKPVEQHWQVVRALVQLEPHTPSHP